MPCGALKASFVSKTKSKSQVSLVMNHTVCGGVAGLRKSTTTLVFVLLSRSVLGVER